MDWLLGNLKIPYSKRNCHALNPPVGTNKMIKSIPATCNLQNYLKFLILQSSSLAKEGQLSARFAGELSSSFYGRTFPFS